MQICSCPFITSTVAENQLITIIQFLMFNSHTCLQFKHVCLQNSSTFYQHLSLININKRRRHPNLQALCPEKLSQGVVLV